MTLSYRAAPLEMKAAPDTEGRFEGYASVFGNVDSGLDVVMPGAFAKSLAARSPKMLWQHERGTIIGAWEEAREDSRGLYVKGRVFSDVPKGAEALTLLREGALDSMSIGYRTVEAAEDGRVRKLLEVELWEVSLVTFPMNELARVTAVKADAITTEREFEAFLRDAGFSRKEAAAIASRGFKAARQRDAGQEGDTEGRKALMAQLSQLMEAFNG